jgi:hypothetical protein
MRALFLSLLCVASGLSAAPGLLIEGVVPVTVSNKNISIEYVVGDVAGKVHKHVPVTADFLRLLKAFSKKKDFVQRIKNNENSVATELKLLFASKELTSLALMTLNAEESFVVQLIVDEKGSKKVVIYGSAPACPEWITAFVDASFSTSLGGWSLGKPGIVGALSAAVGLVGALNWLSSFKLNITFDATDSDLIASGRSFVGGSLSRLHSESPMGSGVAAITGESRVAVQSGVVIAYTEAEAEDNRLEVDGRAAVRIQAIVRGHLAKRAVAAKRAAERLVSEGRREPDEVSPGVDLLIGSTQGRSDTELHPGLTSRRLASSPEEARRDPDVEATGLAEETRLTASVPAGRRDDSTGGGSDVEAVSGFSEDMVKKLLKYKTAVCSSSFYKFVWYTLDLSMEEELERNLASANFLKRNVSNLVLTTQKIYSGGAIDSIDWVKFFFDPIKESTIDLLGQFEESLRCARRGRDAETNQEVAFTSFLEKLDELKKSDPMEALRISLMRTDLIEEFSREFRVDRPMNGFLSNAIMKRGMSIHLNMVCAGHMCIKDQFPIVIQMFYNLHKVNLGK